MFTMSCSGFTDTTTSAKALFQLQDHVLVCEAEVYQLLAVGKHKPLEVLQDKAVDVAFSKPFLQQKLQLEYQCYINQQHVLTAHI